MTSPLQRPPWGVCRCRCHMLVPAEGSRLSRRNADLRPAAEHIPWLSFAVRAEER